MKKVFLTAEIIKYVAINPQHTLSDIWKIPNTSFFTSIKLIKIISQDVLETESQTVHQRIIDFIRLFPPPNIKPVTDIGDPYTIEGLIQTAKIFIK